MCAIVRAFGASVLGCFLLSSAFAGESWVTSTIKSVYPLANGSFVIIFDVDSTNCSNGNNPNYHYVTVGQNGVTAEGLKLIFSAALAAAAQRVTVQAAYNDSSSSCDINRLSVSYD